MTRKAILKKQLLKLKRKRRVRGKVSGVAQTPRVSIYKSNRTIYAQAIDDVAGVTLASCNGQKSGIKANKEGAAALGAEFAASLKAAGIEKVVFDTNGNKYHGVVSAFADALRENAINI
jgi:large subunit ribosomal protein L18